MADVRRQKGCHDEALQARIQKQVEATGSSSVEEVLLRLLETQEEQDRWLLENRNAINTQIRQGLDQLDRGEGIPEDQLDSYLTKLKAKSNECAVRPAPRAAQDLVEIWRYIKDHSSVSTADRVESVIRDKIAVLSRRPGAGHWRRNLTAEEVKYFPVYSYLIVYRPEIKPLQVVSILHGRRDVERILSERS